MGRQVKLPRLTRRTKKILLGVGVAVGVGGVVVLVAKSSPGRPTGLAFGLDVSPEFRAKIIAIGKRLKIDPSYLMAIMFAESGLSPRIHIFPIGRDARGGVIYQRSYDVSFIDPRTIGGGFIGFMRPTAEGLGTTLEELLRLDAIDQLDYVELFYLNHRSSGIIPANPSLWRLYMSTFYPAKAHLADNPEAILFSADSVGREKKAYFGNISADRDQDGDIEIQEAMARIDGILHKGLSDKHRF